MITKDVKEIFGEFNDNRKIKKVIIETRSNNFQILSSFNNCPNLREVIIAKSPILKNLRFNIKDSFNNNLKLFDITIGYPVSLITKSFLDGSIQNLIFEEIPKSFDCNDCFINNSQTGRIEYIRIESMSCNEVIPHSRILHLLSSQPYTQHINCENIIDKADYILLDGKRISVESLYALFTAATKPIQKIFLSSELINFNEILSNVLYHYYSGICHPNIELLIGKGGNLTELHKCSITWRVVKDSTEALRVIRNSIKDETKKLNDYSSIANKIKLLQLNSELLQSEYIEHALRLHKISCLLNTYSKPEEDRIEFDGYLIPRVIKSLIDCLDFLAIRVDSIKHPSLVNGTSVILSDIERNTNKEINLVSSTVTHRRKTKTFFEVDIKGKKITYETPVLVYDLEKVLNHNVSSVLDNLTFAVGDMIPTYIDHFYQSVDSIIMQLEGSLIPNYIKKELFHNDLAKRLVILARYTSKLDKHMGRKELLMCNFLTGQILVGICGRLTTVEIALKTPEVSIELVPYSSIDKVMTASNGLLGQEVRGVQIIEVYSNITEFIQKRKETANLLRQEVMRLLKS